MAAFGFAQALRRGRGPAAAAAKELGRRKLFRAPLQGLQGMMRRSMASGTGTEVAGGKATGGSGAGMGQCTGGCTKEIMDLRAEMLDQHQQLSMRIVNATDQSIALRESIVKNQVSGNAMFLRTMLWVVVGSMGTVGFTSVVESWEKKDPARKDGTGAVA